MSDDPNTPLGPPSIVRQPTLEEDEKALRKGNTWVLVAGGLAGLLVVGGLIAFLAQEDPSEQYGTIGRQVNGMKSEHFDGFWTCALPNQPLARLTSNDDLRAAIEQRAERQPSAYAQHVRQRCIVQLDEHQAGLTTLIAPAELQPQLDALDAAIRDLHSSWDDYLEYLDRAETYDEAAAAPQLRSIAKGWYDYKIAHNQINSTIREHLNP